MATYAYSNFTVVKVPFHLNYPEKSVESIQEGVLYLESVGGGFLHAQAQIDAETSCTVSLDLGVIWGKSEGKVFELFDAAIERDLQRLRQIPSAYH